MGAAEGGSSSVSGGKISSSSLSSLSHVHDLLLLSLSLAEDPEPHVLGHAARAILLACFSKAGFKGAVLRLVTVSTPARRCHSGVGQFGPVGSQNSGQHHPHIFVHRFPEPSMFFLSVVQLESANLSGECEH